MFFGALLCCLFGIQLIQAFPDGAPCAVLSTLEPNAERHGAKPQTSSLASRYTITMFQQGDIHEKPVTKYSVGQTYVVRLSGGPFKGIMFQARQVQDNGEVYSSHRLGEFLEQNLAPQGLKYLFCSSINNKDTITHANNEPKRTIELLWRPAHAKGPLQFLVTIAEDRTKYWVAQQLPNSRFYLDDGTDSEAKPQESKGREAPVAEAQHPFEALLNSQKNVESRVVQSPAGQASERKPVELVVKSAQTTTAPQPPRPLTNPAPATRITPRTPPRPRTTARTPPRPRTTPRRPATTRRPTQRPAARARSGSSSISCSSLTDAWPKCTEWKDACETGWVSRYCRKTCCP